MTRNKQTIEVVTVNQERRRRWSAEEKAALVRETYEPGMNVSLVARKHGVGASQLFNWRKLEREGALTAVTVGESVVPASELAAARAQIPKAPKRPVSSRVHNGVVAVDESNQRWCSDGFEIACDNGEVVTGVFMKDCCDREIIAWRAWSERGLPGEPVRDMLVEAVEARFGQASVGSTRLEFLSDNGGAYRAHETHALVRALGIEPVHTPVCSPQSNGIAESFVNTFKRDYVNLMDRSSAEIVLAQLPDAFMHFNEVHPHSSLKWKSPRMFRRELARRAQESGAN